MTKQTAGRLETEKNSYPQFAVTFSYKDNGTWRRFKTKSNRETSNLSFKGQNPCFRISLSILQLFSLQFLKTNDLNICQRQHHKQSPVGTRGNKYQSSEKLCKTGKIYHHFFFNSTFICYVNFKCSFWHLLLLEMISFVKIFKAVAERFAMLIPSIEHFCPLVTQTCGGFLLNLTV